MRAKQVYQLFEEQLVSYTGSFSVGTVTIFKNPQSIKRMSPWARAFSDQNGNFYIADEENHFEQDMTGTTHTDILDKARNTDNSIKTDWDRHVPGYVNGIAWQRAGKTNNFYLSESYVDMPVNAMESEVAHYFNLPTFFKPKDAKFVLSIIDSLYDYDKDKPQYDYVPQI